jgi:hypothetical protein
MHSRPGPDDRPAVCSRYTIDTVSVGRVAARCACGWKSDPAITSGMAGTLWDKHRASALRHT